MEVAAAMAAFAGAAAASSSSRSCTPPSPCILLLLAARVQAIPGVRLMGINILAADQPVTATVERAQVVITPPSEELVLSVTTLDLVAAGLTVEDVVRPGPEEDVIAGAAQAQNRGGARGQMDGTRTP